MVVHNIWLWCYKHYHWHWSLWLIVHVWSHPWFSSACGTFGGLSPTHNCISGHAVVFCRWFCAWILLPRLSRGYPQVSRGVEVGRAIETNEVVQSWSACWLWLLHFIYICRCIEFSHIGNRVEKPDRFTTSIWQPSFSMLALNPFTLTLNDTPGSDTTSTTQCVKECTRSHHDSITPITTHLLANVSRRLTPISCVFSLSSVAANPDGSWTVWDVSGDIILASFSNPTTPSILVGWWAW